MRATFTQNLMTGKAKVTVMTCSESINYMGEIFGFIKDNGFNARMTTDFYKVNFTITDYDGDHLTSKIPKIMKFIHGVQNGSYKE